MLKKSNRMVSVALLALCMRIGFADSQIAVYPKQPLQRIDGFGASDAWYAWEIHLFNAATQTKILNDLFSTTSGAGLSLLRHRVPPEIEPLLGVWDWTQVYDDVWLSKQAASRGVSQIWATVWSPPAWMKSNQNVNEGGEVEPGFYQDYADYLATYVRYLGDQFGVPISAISIANEPDQTQSYESSNWTGQQFHDFIANNLMPTLQSSGMKTKVIIPEFSGWSDALAAQSLADPVTANFLGIVATHDYWMGITPFIDAISAGKTIWETEVSNLGTDDPSIADGLNWAEVIHQSLVVGQVNAWHYWWLFSDVGDTTGQSLISGTPSNNTFTTKKRLWTIGNFSRFVRPGAHMLSLSSNNPESGVYVTAFAGNNGALTVVAINANSSATNLTVGTNQAGDRSAVEYRTSATEDLKLIGTVPVTGETFTASLAAESVSTFVCQPPITIAHRD
jgi:glucuronoarabinoxylan endo-1,4-beta-xylanase